ncbi:MAG: ABC transporter ATP-binding protein [Candidatus Heimdallarchaeota archaeon]|nr:ABC transporter ATP-binding protein [Candidatus Heimdallarchaeota archaeon]
MIKIKEEYALETKDLHGGYGRHEILHGINMHVKQNEIVSIIGPNGSGKSTLIKVIYGLATHHSGEIFYRNLKDEANQVIDITHKKANELVPMGIAYVPQRDSIFPRLTLEENLSMGGYTMPSDQVEEEIERVYDAYPILRERKSDRAKTLSGGQRQLLALGRALMIKPKLIILDEPSAALQPSLVFEIMDQIKSLRDDLGETVLLVEQNTKSALAISDRGYILAAGQLVHTDTGHELLHNTDLAAYYLGAKSIQSS